MWASPLGTSPPSTSPLVVLRAPLCPPHFPGSLLLSSGEILAGQGLHPRFPMHLLLRSSLKRPNLPARTPSTRPPPPPSADNSIWCACGCSGWFLKTPASLALSIQYLRQRLEKDFPNSFPPLPGSTAGLHFRPSQASGQRAEPAQWNRHIQTWPHGDLSFQPSFSRLPAHLLEGR